MLARSPAILAAALPAPDPLALKQLQAALSEASPATTFRYLSQVPQLRSYNYNDRFYTHADPQRFDRHGLLSLGCVRLSADRSLSATVPPLVRQGPTSRTITVDPTVVIEVLLVFIRHPASSPAHLARHLRGLAPPIRLPQVAVVFTRFDLAQVNEKGGPSAC